MQEEAQFIWYENICECQNLKPFDYKYDGLKDFILERRIGLGHNGELYIVRYGEPASSNVCTTVCKVIHSIDISPHPDRIIEDIFTELKNTDLIRDHLNARDHMRGKVVQCGKHLLHPAPLKQSYMDDIPPGRYLMTMDERLSEFWIMLGKAQAIFPIVDYIAHFDYNESLFREIVQGVMKALVFLHYNEFVIQTLTMETIVVASYGVNHTAYVCPLQFDAEWLYHKSMNRYEKEPSSRDPVQMEKDSDIIALGTVMADILVAWGQIENRQQLLDPEQRYTANVSEDMKDFISRCVDPKRSHPSTHNLSLDMLSHPFVKIDAKTLQKNITTYTNILYNKDMYEAMLKHERLYLQHLDSLAYTEKQELLRPLVSPMFQQQVNCFEHATKLYRFHKDFFYPDLVATKGDPSAIDACFVCHRAEMTELYVDFCERIENTMAAVYEATKVMSVSRIAEDADILNDYHRIIQEAMEGGKQFSLLGNLRDRHGTAYIGVLTEKLVVQPYEHLKVYVNHMQEFTGVGFCERSDRIVHTISEHVRKARRNAVPVIGLPKRAELPTLKHKMFNVMIATAKEGITKDVYIIITKERIIGCKKIENVSYYKFLWMVDIKDMKVKEYAEAFELISENDDHSLFIQRVNGTNSNKLRKECLADIYKKISALIDKEENSTKRKLFERPLDDLAEESECPVPFIVRQLIEEIDKKLKDESILDICDLYSMSGLARAEEYVQAFECFYATGDTTQILKKPKISQMCVLLKNFLLMLPKPLLPMTLCEEYAKIYKPNHFQHQVDDNKGMILRAYVNQCLSQNHLRTLNVILRHLERNSVNIDDNKLESLYCAVYPLLFGISDMNNCRCEHHNVRTTNRRCCTCISGITITMMLIRNRKNILWRHKHEVDSKATRNTILSSHMYIKRYMDQHCYAIPFIFKNTSDNVYVSNGTIPMRGWIFMHFNGEQITRQLELHPSKKPMLYIAGKDDKYMCKRSHGNVKNLLLNKKKSIAITIDEFNFVWRKYDGDAYFNQVKDKPKVVEHFTD